MRSHDLELGTSALQQEVASLTLALALTLNPNPNPNDLELQQTALVRAGEGWAQLTLP